MKVNKTQKITQLINTAGKMNNICIYDVEFKSSLVRVYIDNVEKHVDLHICEKFMKTLLFLLRSEKMEDVECEISSPGVERQLKKDWHFLTAGWKNGKSFIPINLFFAMIKNKKNRRKQPL